MDDKHLANTIAMMERKLGPDLFVFEMAQALLTEGFSARLDDKNIITNVEFWLLMSLRREQERRQEITHHAKPA